MTWQLASFALLALALGAGFAWYERARPSAKVLALVATLAALAALGRIAFAPLPSVKPTTDIVLLSGYVLGGAPGFAVGSVAALASNVFFGQGPFTPWQMAAWGGVGVFGALLARVFGRDLGRWSLAAACALAGLAYGGWHGPGPVWVRILAAVALPLAGALIWARWVAPKASRPIPDPRRLIPEWVVFGGAAIALIVTGQVIAGCALAVLAAGNRAALHYLGSGTG